MLSSQQTYVMYFTLTMLVNFISLASSTNTTNTLYIHNFLNTPYLIKQNNTMAGELPYIMKFSLEGHCKIFKLNIEYAKPVALYTDLLAIVKNVSTSRATDKMIGIAPVLDLETISHERRKHLNIIKVFVSPGYTLVTDLRFKDKLYRITVFGLTQGLTVIVALVVCTGIAAVAIWIVERSRKLKSSFSYHMIPGVWDGIWWASVTATTVGYGDKTPQSCLGRLIGLIWLFVSCTLLSAFTAILTGTVTQENSFINGRKIAYLNGTTAKHYIDERTGIPVPAATYDDAIKMALNREVYGAMLDTNYVTSEQERLYKRGIVVDARFHTKSIHALLTIVKSSLDPNNTIANCLAKEFEEHAKIHRLRPKGNPYRSMAEELTPSSSSVSLSFTCLYAIVAVFVAIGISIEITIFIKSRRKRRESCESLELGNPHQKLQSKLEESKLIIDQEMANIKIIVAEIAEGKTQGCMKSNPKLGETNRAMTNGMIEDRPNFRGSSTAQLAN